MCKTNWTHLWRPFFQLLDNMISGAMRVTSGEYLDHLGSLVTPWHTLSPEVPKISQQSWVNWVNSPNKLPGTRYDRCPEPRSALWFSPARGRRPSPRGWICWKPMLGESRAIPVGYMAMGEVLQWSVPLKFCLKYDTWWYMDINGGLNEKHVLTPRELSAVLSWFMTNGCLWRI